MSRSSSARRVGGAALAVLLGLLASRRAIAQEAADSALQWIVPPLLPPGARLAVVSGDPTVPGQCTMKLIMPDGYRLPPHYHPSYEHVEILGGTLLAGMGDRLDVKRTHPLVAGDSATAPAGMHHFSIAKGRTVLLVTFTGPYTITYLRAEDAPQRRVFPYGY
jgi:quercetin dioxygenase-like cupin family protein